MPGRRGMSLSLFLSVALALSGAGAGGEEHEAMRKQAIAAITRGDGETALARFRNALHTTGFGTGWYARLQLAQVLGALGRHKDAMHEYKKVMGKGNAIPPPLLAAGIEMVPLRGDGPLVCCVLPC
jgi:hypothetical protein